MNFPSRAVAFLAAVLSAALFAAPAAPSDAEPTAKERAQGYREFVVLAKPLKAHRPTIDAAEAADRLPTRVRQKFSRFGDLRVLALDSADAVDRAIARLRATGRYEFVERDHFFRSAAVPNDPAFSTQWSLSNTGQSGGVVGADIKAVAAWDIIREAPNVVVAVLDSGVAINHPDITANLWRNPAPTFGDINGASFLGGLRSGDPSDVKGHGSHVAGIIGATGNNGTLVTGVAWRVQLMPIRCGTASGFFASSDFAAAIDYAISHGAHIMNASLFTDTYSLADLTVLTAAREAGVILVVAAGNENVNVDAKNRYYPGSYALDNIVTVGSSNRRDVLSSFSNYGAAVDLVAPGEAISSLNYATTTSAISFSGTSMASPLVAGSLALLKARFPADTYRQLINRLLRTVDQLPAYAGKAQTGGRLNLLAAVTSTDSRPFNDDFSTRARVVGSALAIRSNNTGATAEPGEPAHSTLSATATLWWEWIAPATGPVTLDTVGSSYDTVLAVYTGTSLASLTPVAANDNNGALPTSRLTFSAQAGTTYQFAVGAKSAATGLTLLNVGTAPANDTFAAAAPLAGESTRVSATNIAAGREPGEPLILGFPGGASVWYRWTAPRSGRFQVSVLSNAAAAGINFDPILAVYTGSSVSALTLLDASDNTADDNAHVGALCTINAVSGITYFIAVDSKNGANTGDFTLTVTDSQWQASTLRDVTGAPAVAPDGTLYVGSTDFFIHAFASDGTAAWRYPTGDLLENSTPAVAADGTVYTYSLDGKLYALRPGGSQRWIRDFGVTGATAPNAVCSSAAIATDGTIFLKAGDGFLHALNPADGTTRWRFNTAAAAANSSPVIAPDGTIYQGSSNCNLYAFAPDGSLKWNYDTTNAVTTSPALDAAGNLYFATSGRLISLTPAGAARWAYTGATGMITSSPALSADGATVYFGGTDSRLHAVNTTDGTPRWTFPLGGAVNFSSPAVDANGIIYIGCDNFKLYAVRSNGTLQRTYDTGAPIRSSPAIFGTSLYVGSNDAKLYAFELGAPAAAGPWPQYRQNARRLGRAADAAIVIGVAPLAQSALLGMPLTLRVTADGPGPLSFQWQKAGLPIPGATSATFTLSTPSDTDSGAYSVRVSSPAATAVTSPAAQVSVVPPLTGRLTNLSVRTTAGTGAQTLIVGFALAGSPDKPILLRAVGPALALFGLSGILDDPRLELFSGTTVLAANDNWAVSTAGLSTATLANTFAATGAFPLPPTSLDAALVRTLGPGSYSAQISGSSSAPGLALAELYDTATTSGARLINVSARAQVGTGGDIMIVGFALSGTVPRTILIRAIGPTLSSFGVSAVLADPQLALYRSTTLLATNDNWGVSGPGTPGPVAFASTFAAVGAFPLASPATKDAALLITVPPGSYTAQVSGANFATGVALVEIYEVP